jgi:hypothetical protein
MRISTIAACLVLAVAAVLPSRPWAPYRESPWRFEARIESSASGIVQLYYDLGSGMSEEQSAVVPIAAGVPKVLSFPLPYGRIKMLRFDPLDRECTMTVSDARIVDGSGRTVASISPEQFQPYVQIESVDTRAGMLRVVTVPGGTDPEMIVNLEEPLVVPRPPPWVAVIEVFALALVAVLAAQRAWRSRKLALRARAAALREFARARPGVAVALAALLATAAANYPVVFAGRTIVTPGLGVAALYGENPWLPGAATAEVDDAHKADVAALMWHHLPLSKLESRAIFQDGEVPLWNRYDSAGSPLLGQGQSCLGDPLQVLPILAGGAAWSWELKFLLAKWAFALGVGLCALRAFRSIPAALATAASVAFLGHFVYRINHPAIFSLCYSPWILLCWLGLADCASARATVLWLVALIGANWVEMCSGTAKEAYMLLLSMDFAGACVILACERPVRTRLLLLLGAAAAGVVFAMVGSPVWYTFFRALKASYTSYNVPLAYQLQPGMLIGLFDEAFYRPFQEQLGVSNPSANAFVLLGLLWAVVRWRSVALDRRAVGLFVASLPAFAIAFGVIAPSLVARVPVLGNVQHVDNTLSCTLIVIGCVLSAAGWKEAFARLGSAEGKGEAVAVIALLAAMLAAYLGTAQAVVRSSYWAGTWGAIIKVPAFVHGYGWSLLAASALLLAVLRFALRRGAATPAALLLGLVALGALHWRMALQPGRGFDEYVVRAPHRVDLMARSPAIEALRQRADTDGPFRVLGFHNDLLPGWSIMYGLEGISGPDALVNPYYREFMDAAGITRVWDWRYIVEVADVQGSKPVLDAVNTRFYLGYRMERRPDASILKPFVSEDMDVFESASVWPRAFFTDSVAVYNDLPQYVSWIRAGDGRPFAAIQHSDWVKLDPLPKVSGDLATRRVNPATAYKLTTNTTSFTVEATGPGFIVLTEGFEKDNFHLSVNGEKARYIRVNHAFRGIYVESAGTYEVTYEYYPRGFMRSLEMCGAGLGLIAAALLAVFWPRRAPAPARPGA